MHGTDLVLAILLGAGLSASSGLNTFLPLLLLSAAARFGIADIALNTKFAWLSSDLAIGILIFACIVELVADKFPAVDHMLDSVGTFVRPIAGLVAMASVMKGMDPAVAAAIGLIVGSPLSLGIHTLKAGTRVASSVTTFGCANPVISLAEDVLSLLLSIAAIFAPILVPLALLAVVYVLWRAARAITAKSAPARSAP